METSENKFSDIEHCPIRQVISHFCTKWGLLLICVIAENPNIRFNEICRILPDISAKVLSSTLKTLVGDGLISRKLYAEVPPRVEYSLTERSETLIPLITPLIGWAEANFQDILRSRKKAKK